MDKKLITLHAQQNDSFVKMMKKKSQFLMLLLLCSYSLLAQTRQISGQVKENEKGEPLPGVNIVLSGTTNGTITDLDGKFSLAVPDKGAVELVFTYIGYLKQTVEIGAKNELNITLVSDAKVLDEVVAVGYGNVNRRDVLGSVSSVGEKQLKDVPLSNAAEALAGRLAGVQVTSSEGAPGADVVIRVRGGGSITQDNTPIYIVDGVQLENALSVISPQDIASVDVLKDASTTAIYGARGANGVIIITTKSGKAGKTTISYNGSFGYRQISKTMDVLDPYEFVVWQYEKSKMTNDSVNFRKTYGNTWDTLSNYKNAKAVNWQDEVFGRKAGYQNHNLSINGGSEKTRYNISLTNNTEDGVLIESGFDRKLANVKLDHVASTKLSFGLTARHLNQTVRGAGTSGSGTRTTNRLRHSIQYRPFEIATAAPVDQFDEDYYIRSSGVINPVIMTQAEYRRNYTTGTNLSGYFNYKLLPNLTFASTFGYDNTAIENDLFYSKVTPLARQFATLPIASIGTQLNQTLNNTNTLQYALNDIAKHHDINLLVGQELYQLTAKSVLTETRFFPADISAEKALSNMGLGSPPTGSAQPRASSFENPPSRIFSFFARANYAFDKTFLASVSVRADRSTKFKYENGMLVFPSGSVAYRFTNAPVLKGSKILTDGKIRAGFGTAGNNRIGDLLYLQLYGVTGEYAINHTILPGFAPSALANDKLRWERTLSKNVGLDLGFLNNRIQVTIDAYKNDGKDLLLAVAIPPVTGYTSQLQNVGATSNTGLEIQINGDVMRKKDFRWSSNFNISFNKNKVESLGGLAQQTRNSGWQGSDGADDYLVKVGESVGLMYGFVTDGWYPISDFNYDAVTGYTLKTGVPNCSNIAGIIRPGSLKIKDLNGDGLITTDGDRQVIGNAQPKFMGGWNNQFQYKGFDLSVFLNFVYGNSVYNANHIEWTDGTFPNLNMLAKMKDRWRNVDANGNFVNDPAALAALNPNPQIWSPANAQRYFVKSTDIEDGSFVRVSNVTIGYTLPAALMRQLKASQFRVYATINNAAIFTKYSGYDPEVTARRTDPLTPGVDFAAYPRAKVYVLGINASF
jgi:TonB-dependent starch-binding outer membrane protein SusC